MKTTLAFAATAALALAAPAQARPGGSKGVLEFAPLPQSYVDANDKIITHSAAVSKNGIVTPLTLNSLGSSGDILNNVTFGALLRRDLTPVLGRFGEPEISQNPDFTSILHSDEVSGKIWALAHFERPNPGIAYLVEIEHDDTTCDLTVKSYTPVTSLEEGGIWTPCAGSVTPWMTHLGSEEYEPDARVFAEQLLNTTDVNNNGVPDGVESMNNERYWAWQMSHFGFDMWGNDTVPHINPATTFADWTDNFYPYQYGHGWEFALTDFSTGDYTIRKLYALGRVAFEMCYTALDSKTTYCTDDGSNVGYFRFISDTAGEYDSGKIQCAAFDQTSAANGGEFDLEWITLGTTTNVDEEVKAKVFDKGDGSALLFSDIFDTAEYDNGCPAGFRAVQPGKEVECLKLRTARGDEEQLAAFLETRRMCAYMSGTTEFSKWEGLTYDAEQNKFYTAMSSVYRGMTDDPSKYDIASGNNVRVERNFCGCIYELPVTATAESEYDVLRMVPTLCGKELQTAAGDDGEDNCALDGIANPDNIVALQGYNELLVAEDTGNHQNNYLWSMNMDTKELTRIVANPLDAEATGPMGFAHTDVKTCDYYLIVNQHPGYGAASVNFLTAKAQAVAPAPTQSPTGVPPTSGQIAIPPVEPIQERSVEGPVIGILIGIIFAITGIWAGVNYAAAKNHAAASAQPTLVRDTQAAALANFSPDDL